MNDSNAISPKSPAAIALSVSACAMMLCRIVVGDALGFYFSGVILAAILVPPMALLGVSWRSRWISTLAVADGIGLIWLSSAAQGRLQISQWVWCFLILTTFAFAAAGIVWTLLLCRVPMVVSVAIAMFVALSWLAWPIWASP